MAAGVRRHSSIQEVVRRRPSRLLRRAFERVRSAPFVYPPGWGYQRWAIGAFLPPFFLVRDYWYPDWDLLGLPPPPPDYQWVRYGPDLLLVDLTSGEVVEVVYDVFYY